MSSEEAVKKAEGERKQAMLRAHEAKMAAEQANQEFAAASANVNRAKGRPLGFSKVPRFSPQEIAKRKEEAKQAALAIQERKELEAFRALQEERTVTGVKRGQNFTRSQGSNNRAKKQRSKGPRSCWGFVFKGCIKTNCQFRHEWSQAAYDDYVG